MRHRQVTFWATQSKENAPYYQHKEIGYNYRMSNVVAGIGRGQLKVLDQRIAKKKYIFEYYKEAFRDLDELEMMPIAPYGEPNYWLSCVTINPECEVRPKALLIILRRNISKAGQSGSRCICNRYSKVPPFFNHNPEELSVSRISLTRGLCLPSDTKMTDADLDRIVTRINWFFGAASSRY